MLENTIESNNTPLSRRQYALYQHRQYVRRLLATTPQAGIRPPLARTRAYLVFLWFYIIGNLKGDSLQALEARNKLDNEQDTDEEETGKEEYEKLVPLEQKPKIEIPREELQHIIERELQLQQINAQELAIIQQLIIEIIQSAEFQKQIAMLEDPRLALDEIIDKLQKKLDQKLKSNNDPNQTIQLEQQLQALNVLAATNSAVLSAIANAISERRMIAGQVASYEQLDPEHKPNPGQPDARKPNDPVTQQVAQSTRAEKQEQAQKPQTKNKVSNRSRGTFLNLGKYLNAAKSFVKNTGALLIRASVASINFMKKLTGATKVTATQPPTNTADLGTSAIVAPNQPQADIKKMNAYAAGTTRRFSLASAQQKQAQANGPESVQQSTKRSRTLPTKPLPPGSSN